VPGRALVAALTALLVAGAAGAAAVRAATDDRAAADVPRAAPRDPDRKPRSAPGADAATDTTRRHADSPPPTSTSSGTGEAAARPPQGARPEGAPSMVDATMRIPDLGVRGLRVVAYPGTPDDGPGTRIQNGGVAATPIGPRGGEGPGQVGNYIVTAHRTTSPAPFADLPALRRGDHVYVRASGRVFDYRIVRTRWTSFRSRLSLARQSAAVPGRPGVEPTRAMLTLSTCATPEDHARGNYWSDRFGNPEHRIDKIGVLVGVRPARVARTGRG
jgi:sortase A